MLDSNEMCRMEVPRLAGSVRGGDEAIRAHEKGLDR